MKQQSLTSGKLVTKQERTQNRNEQIDNPKVEATMHSRSHEWSCFQVAYGFQRMVVSAIMEVTT